MKFYYIKMKGIFIRAYNIVLIIEYDITNKNSLKYIKN